MIMIQNYIKLQIIILSTINDKKLKYLYKKNSIKKKKNRKYDTIESSPILPLSLLFLSTIFVSPLFSTLKDIIMLSFPICIRNNFFN